MEAVIQNEGRILQRSASKLMIFEGSHDKALGPARSVLTSHSDWCVGVRSMRDVAQSNTTLESLNIEIAQLRSDFPEKLADSEVENVPKNLITAFRARRTWKTKRQSTSRLPGTLTQMWLNRFSEFLASYSGIVEIMKGADNQYGGIAYGTLSVLLCIPTNKSKYEFNIEDALEEFAYSFPRLQILNGVYPEKSERLKTLIASVYAEVIYFARECVIYYQKSSLGRIKATTLRLPVNGIHARVSTIRQLVSQVQKEAESLLHQRIASLDSQAQNLVIQIQAMQSQLSERHVQEDLDNLGLLKSILNVNKTARNVDIRAYKDLLDYLFDDLKSADGKKIKMTPEMFTKKSIIQRWTNDTGSSMVVLAGDSCDAVSDSTLSWLSHGSILTIEHFLQSEIIVAYYFCQTGSVGPSRPRNTIQEIGASLIGQIATQVPSVLCSNLESIRGTVESVEWRSDVEADGLTVVSQMLLKILSALDQGTKVVFVLDRLDECIIDAKTLIKWLLQIVRDASCMLKVMVVSQRTSYRGYLTEEEKTRHSDIYLEDLDWDQKNNY